MFSVDGGKGSNRRVLLEDGNGNPGKGRDFGHSGLWFYLHHKEFLERFFLVVTDDLIYNVQGLQGNYDSSKRNGIGRSHSLQDAAKNAHCRQTGVPARSKDPNAVGLRSSVFRRST